MPRTVSSLARQALNAPQTDEAFLLLLQISAPDIVDGPLRVVRDSRNLISRGNEYERFPFDIEFPPETEDAPPVIRLSLASDQRIVEAVRNTLGPVTVILEAVMASTPDQVEAGPFEFTLRNVDGDENQISGSLHFEDLMNAPFPEASFTPALFPGLS